LRSLASLQRNDGYRFAPPILQIYLTTKHTTNTKVSGIDISKLLDFALFVTFVVKFAFSSLVAALPRSDPTAGILP